MTPPPPMAGLRVLSMAEQYPGPLATMILADMGADVIQVERPGTGDPSRFLTGFYEALNRGKRSVALDIRDPADRARLLELADAADVFLEGFRPGKLARQGLGYAALAARNPGLVCCSITGYGQTGPYRDRPGHDLSIQGVGGALEERLDGAVHGLPPALLLGDNAAGLFAVIGILAALAARPRSGRGSHVDIAMSDSVTAPVAPFLGMAGEAGAAAPPQAEPAYDLFRCADGRRITLSIAHEDACWDRLAADLGLAASGTGRRLLAPWSLGPVARPWLTHQITLTRSPRRPRKTNRCPANGSCFSTAPACAARAANPLRMSVTPAASQTRVLAGTGISPSGPGSAAPRLRDPSRR